MYTMTTSFDVLDDRYLISGNWCDIFFANVGSGASPLPHPSAYIALMSLFSLCGR
jgi:hypothetical protein